MARSFFINGECMVRVKSAVIQGEIGTSISTLQDLGLAEGPITVSLDMRHMDVHVDTYGGQIPAEVQYKLSAANVAMRLVHFDRDILDACLRRSMGGVTTVGLVGRAGIRLGGGVARFAENNNFISQNLSSQVASKPWRFGFSYLTATPMEFPIGVERSVVVLNWRVIPYQVDPWGGGLGTGGNAVALWDHIADT